MDGNKQLNVDSVIIILLPSPNWNATTIFVIGYKQTRIYLKTMERRNIEMVYVYKLFVFVINNLSSYITLVSVKLLKSTP